MREAWERAQEAGAWLASQAPSPPVAVVLGSGLGGVADALDAAHGWPFDAIPHQPGPRVPGHAGRLVLGTSPGGTRVAACAGRVHAYEGHPVGDVVHLVRAFAAWGVRAVLLTNAAGGLRTALAPGSVVRLVDHLNLTGLDPLRGAPHPGAPSPFVDLSGCWDPALGAVAQAAVAAAGLPVSPGVYVGVCGPSYETPAEVRAYAALGGDVVGMSTVCEAIAARHAGLRVAGLSLVTNPGAGLGAEALSHDDVQAVAASVRPALVLGVLGALDAMAAAVVAPG